MRDIEQRDATPHQDTVTRKRPTSDSTGIHMDPRTCRMRVACLLTGPGRQPQLPMITFEHDGVLVRFDEPGVNRQSPGLVHGALLKETFLRYIRSSA